MKPRSLLSSLPALLFGLVFWFTPADAQTSKEEVKKHSIPHEWIEQHARSRLQALAKQDGTESARIMPFWRINESSSADLSEEERTEVISHIDSRLNEQLARQSVPTLRLEVMITEAWRPIRMLNALLFAIPIPGSGPLLASRGGISIESTVYDFRTNTVLARLKCSKRAGLSSIAGLFGRMQDAKEAARHCTDQLLLAFTKGHPHQPTTETIQAPMGEAGSVQ